MWAQHVLQQRRGGRGDARWVGLLASTSWVGPAAQPALGAACVALGAACVALEAACVYHAAFFLF